MQDPDYLPDFEDSRRPWTEPLTEKNIAAEIAGLYEDLVNWDHGHIWCATDPNSH